jgi:aryl-alcohol dehydrogenase-like predicted oxidoreductase
VRTAAGLGDVEGLAPEAVRRAAQDSLVRLKTACLDILLAHHDDPKTPLLDTWAAFTALVAAGRVKKVGISNFQPHRVIELAELIRQHSLAPVAVVQLQYSLIHPITTAGLGKLVLLDQEMMATLKAHLPGAMVMGYSPLLHGLYETNPAAAVWPPEYDSPENRRAVARVQQEAKAGGISPSAQVLKSIVAQGVFPITATGKVKRLRENLAPFAF